MEASESATTSGALHPPNCFGCGTNNERSLGVRISVDGHEAHFGVTPEDWAQGGFGVLHGGYISALVDEAMVSAASVWADGLVVTSKIEVRFLRPLLVRRELRGRVTWDGVVDRRLSTEAELYDEESDAPAVRARATFHRISGRVWLDAGHRTGHTAAQQEWKDEEIGPFVSEQIRHVFPLVLDTAAIERAVVLELRLDEAPATPWRFELSPEGVQARAADGARPDATLSGPFSGWIAVVRQRKRLTEVAAEGGLQVDGDIEAADHALGALTQWSDE